MTLSEAIQIMTNEIVSILADNKPTIYLFGSVVLNDFRLGWSDIDIAVLTEHEIGEQQANALVGLRQAMLERYPSNPYFRLFEGGMLSADAFLNGRSERTVYWGTSGQRIADNWGMDSFGIAELLDSGILLHGDDIRGRMTYPTYAQMRDDIARHVQAARKYGKVVGWLLDIARGIYTLRTGKVIAKTAAGEWALENGLCPDADALKMAIQNRYNAQLSPEKSMDNAVIQRFTDVIDTEFTNTVGRFAESELRRMNIAFNELSLIRDKDGVSVWRVIIDTDSYVMKCFDKPEYRREITNYQLLNSLGVPTLKMIALTGCSLVMEDIERSEYRLGTPDDMNDPNTAEKIALWYRTLHQNGREYANNHDFIDEYDSLTLDNLRLIQEKTGTSGLPVWQVIEKHFDKIRSAVMELPRTLVYTDFYYTNLAVARDGRSALMFDYNFFYKSYVYSDIRNVCSSLGTDEVKSAFQSAYGGFDEREVMVDNVACELSSLVIACQRKDFPNWANDGLEKVKDGRLLAAVEKLLEGIWAQSITSSASRTCHMTNPIISAITEFIFVADEPKKSDAIFIPGGSFPELPEHAAQLYHMGLAPVLVPSGGLSVKLDKWPGVRSKKDIYNGNYQTDCEFYADVLIKCGAPGEAILKEDKSGFTKENAAFSRKLCDENGLIVRRGIIVCKSFHARRCQMMYQLAFPEAELLICPVDCFDITRENWHTFEYGINRVLGELARCGNQMNDEIKGWLL